MIRRRFARVALTKRLWQRESESDPLLRIDDDPYDLQTGRRLVDIRPDF